MRPFAAAIVFLLLYSHSFAQQVEDWIYFKDSTIVKGLVTEIKEGGIEVETAEGLQNYRLHKIAKIVKQHPELMEKKYENQTAKGTLKISGLFSFSHLNYEIPYGARIDGVTYYNNTDYSYTLLQISPSIMYFPIDNFGYGVILNVQGLAYNGSEMELNTGFGTGLQYYFSSGNVRPFLNAQAILTFGDEFGYAYSGGAGLSIYMGKNIALQPLIQYGRTAPSASSGSKEMFIYSAGLAYFIF